MRPVATITIAEAETGEECVIVVRSAAGGIAIAVSRRLGGDVEAVLPLTDAHELAKGLSDALRAATPNTGP